MSLNPGSPHKNPIYFKIKTISKDIPAIHVDIFPQSDILKQEDY
jgi:hypothetical protein